MRLLQHDNFIVNEDNLDLRWEQLTGESVHEIIFLSKHTAVSNRPALTVHPIGTLSGLSFLFLKLMLMDHIILKLMQGYLT